MGERMRVYLDTSGWNALCDWGQRRSRKWTQGVEYLFSSCNLEEFANASPGRGRQLADYAWQVSNRTKLLDHLELTVEEVSAYQLQRETDWYDRTDAGFQPAWRALRTQGLNTVIRGAVQADTRRSKDAYREWFREGRRTFQPLFVAAEKVGLKRSWPEMQQELLEGPEMRQGLRTSLLDAGLLAALPNSAELEKVPWSSTPCTTCWYEYHIALYHLVSHDSKRLGKPDLGDQVDFRHAAYAGLADEFVTGDMRMHAILSTMLSGCRSRVTTPTEHIQELAGRSL